MTVCSDISKLYHLLYFSRARDLLTAPHVRCILEVSQRNNAKRGVTGFLYAENDMFLQFLEGGKPELNQLQSHLCADPRHFDITILSEGPLKHRFFPDWDMKLANTATLSLGDLLGAPLSRAALSRLDPFDIVVFMAANVTKARD